EVPYVLHMLRDNTFDQIYHEHLSYFSLYNLEKLCQQNSMLIFNAEEIDTHGGSLRVHIKKEQNNQHRVSEKVRGLLENEYEMGLRESTAYYDFADQTSFLQNTLSQMIREQHEAGLKIIGYGAPAKATTLLNTCGITYPQIDYIIDTNPAKQGRQLPGTGIPILPPETLQQDPPDIVLILAWNYADYILDCESELRRKGVKFIIPFPQPRLV
ncbi:MAG: methyltransferase C-terminal domain-containing protein, partial [Candidatus Puniceispirillales bacterium]